MLSCELITLSLILICESLQKLFENLLFLVFCFVLGIIEIKSIICVGK